jgi:5,10-methylenetetrahydrofolate reductase
LIRTYHEFRVENLVLVGGESSQIRYPGPSVLETATWITEYLNRGRWPYDSSRPAIPPTDFFLGGITIPTRRKPDPERDEPARLIQKSRRGIQFFTSQVLYEPFSMQRLLRDYAALCQAEGVPPCRVFLSFAPVSSPSDVQFLKWLGVEIPPDVEQELLKGWLGVAWRSIRVAERVLQDILDFVSAEHIAVPLGLNVEHITSRNFEVSAEMIARLVAVFQRHFRREAPPDTAAEWALQLTGLSVPDA